MKIKPVKEFKAVWRQGEHSRLSAKGQRTSELNTLNTALRNENTLNHVHHDLHAFLSSEAALHSLVLSSSLAGPGCAHLLQRWHGTCAMWQCPCLRRSTCSYLIPFEYWETWVSQRTKQGSAELWPRPCIKEEFNTAYVTLHNTSMSLNVPYYITANTELSTLLTDLAVS